MDETDYEYGTLSSRERGKWLLQASQIQRPIEGALHDVLNQVAVRGDGDYVWGWTIVTSFAVQGQPNYLILRRPRKR